jgi:hypothetical protein
LFLFICTIYFVLFILAKSVPWVPPVGTLTHTQVVVVVLVDQNQTADNAYGNTLQ